MQKSSVQISLENLNLLKFQTPVRIVAGASATDYASQRTTCYVYACIKFYVHAVGEVGLTQPC